MITTRTPYRVSFFGGGTDFEEWFREHGGAFLSMAIDKYCYIHCRELPPFFDYKSRIVWSKIEQVNCSSEVTHPVIRSALEMENIENVEIHHVGDLPARSGLGSSSAFTVGVLGALRSMKNDVSSARQLALDAIHLERNLLKEAGGIQDQIATAFGGLNYVNIKTDGTFEVQQINLSPDQRNEFEQSLLLVFTGIFRNSFEVADSQVRNIPQRRTQLQRLQGLTAEARSLFSNSDFIRDFGLLLNETWAIKKELSTKITNSQVDMIYDTAIRAGAYGGKLLGAGAGGFMVFVVPARSREKVKKALHSLIQVPISIDEKGTVVDRGTF